MTPSDSLVTGFNLSSRPSNRDSEQDELMMKAKAPSLCKNISEAASALGLTSESNSSTTSKPHQHPNILKAEKDDLNNPR